MSYSILTDLGYETTRHRRFLRPLHTDEETPKECKQSEVSNVTGMISPKFHKSSDSSDDITYSADVPKRSALQQKAKDSSLRPPQMSPALPTNKLFPNKITSAPSTNITKFRRSNINATLMRPDAG